MKKLNVLSNRQQSLLKIMLNNPSGLTVDRMSQLLSISRNAVNQHLNNLDKLGFITKSRLEKTLGRPSALYNLTHEGKELFQRHYALFAFNLVELLETDLGQDKLNQYMDELGKKLASAYVKDIPTNMGFDQKVDLVRTLMQDLGYETVNSNNDNKTSTPQIIATNCVFHDLAEKYESVCRLDHALMGNLLNTQVVQEECMLRGGTCCKFVFKN